AQGQRSRVSDAIHGAHSVLFSDPVMDNSVCAPSAGEAGNGTERCIISQPTHQLCNKSFIDVADRRRSLNACLPESSRGWQEILVSAMTHCTKTVFRCGLTAQQRITAAVAAKVAHILLMALQRVVALIHMPQKCMMVYTRSWTDTVARFEDK
ncbi:hypothetical protein DPMN_016041, partial [Dreissena polymorpha]